MTTMERNRKLRRAPHANARNSAADLPNGWRMLRRNGVEILQAEILTRLGWLVHGFSTRTGGASELEGARVLNLGHTEWDARENVAANRQRFAESLGADEMRVATLRQIHSDLVRVFSAPPAQPLKGDASVTRTAQLLLAVQTADCVPILLADTRRRVVAAVHAGWRGTLRRIAAKTIGKMQMEFGTRPRDVIAALGPAIGRCCYEVGPEVAQAYAGQFPRAAEWFDGPFAQLAMGEEPNPLPWLTMMPPGHEPPPPRVKLDLIAANRWQLEDAGLKAENITACALCTACRTDMLFSYRRERPTGRLMGVIGFR